MKSFQNNRNKSEVQIKIKSSKAFDAREVYELTDMISKINKLKSTEEAKQLKQKQLYELGRVEVDPKRNVG
jgi:hypothetical protein